MQQRLEGESDAPVLVSIDDGVGRITLNRPERRNALSPEMIDGLAQALSELNELDDVAALLITGAGRAFCSGGDVKAFAEQGGEGGGAPAVDPAAIEQQRRAQRATVGTIYRSPKPVVAALPGAVAGAGVGLALAADLRIGCSSTVLVTAFADIGLSGDFGTAWLLDRMVGPTKARELLYLSPRIGANECLALGLVNRLIPDDELDSAAMSLAKRLAHGPSQALAGMKDNLLRAPREELEDSMDAEVALHKATGTTADHVAAVHAFMTKQRPVFSRRWRGATGAKD
ncbi:enoyl-CoA hydratase-related protein [Amycolatopsis sp. ATCC 39116]|uniref:enoyl-CoA hydratase-related protein n=1 Tax=Amycolatopsis sp. (strain ATCC 39116 / 75iv2) TaxID=385957 RepID=UPI000262557B|nr:enoyl-CoA hydratase-related protein [Amycolatopsis sp. ATCC 39116]